MRVEHAAKGDGVGGGEKGVDDADVLGPLGDLDLWDFLLVVALGRRRRRRRAVLLRGGEASSRGRLSRTSGDVRLNMFGSSTRGLERDEGFARGDGATTPVEARGVETLAVLDEQQLWAMGLLGNEHETKNLSREESAHSEIWDEPAAWVDSETQLVPELRNELLELMHQKRPRSTEPGDVDEYLVL